MVTPIRRILQSIGAVAFGSDQTSHAERRDFTRAYVDTLVTVYFDGQTYYASLRDVSISGALIEPTCGMDKGAEFELELPNIPGRVSASVMRRTDSGVGIRFANTSAGVLVAGWSRGTTGATKDRSQGGGR